ncbi:MAG: hypothetical protein BMS9Abin30_0694 [Gammaproteobacteria bacterium]|nr:MAG: hypothetical protein BMS9Abin30_0694 [Gammaproteobacteria bacterium]
MSIPILTYHAINVIDNSYVGNDHLALASDLLSICELGFKIIPLSRIVDWHQGLLGDEEVSRSVAITFDDGSWFDFYDLDHPTCGTQRSMFNVLKDFNAGNESVQQAHATSFVIGSPQARSSLDKSGLIGKDWWGDQWWSEASSSGILDVECHSWDHVHPELDHVAQQNQVKGDFSQVKNFADSEIQFKQAGEYIAKKLGGKQPTLFAYPYGSANAYVVTDYLPKNQSRHKFRAAFTTDPRAVLKTDNRWLLPRFVFGRDWTSPQGLRDILKRI